MMPWDKESFDERRAREFDFWRGVRERRAQGNTMEFSIDPNMIQTGPGKHWWVGNQAGA